MIHSEMTDRKLIEVRNALDNDAMVMIISFLFAM